MKIYAFCAVAGVAATVSVAALAPAADAQSRRMPRAAVSLCQAGEQVLFQCAAGTRTIALCGSGAGASRTVQYRYGRPGAVEIAIPARGMTGISRANIPYSGGGETQVNAVNGATTYSVYSRTVRTGFAPGGTNNPQFSAGVEVRQGGRIIARRACTAPTDAQFEAAAYEVIPEGSPILSD